ncbi:plasmid mobilization relaxosome protein MobC [Flavobacterium sp. fv08]|uniref:plasmid mobilization protein n=1 Tax=Flavobacterium sp. fv08 TaxID=1761784 RepID=UPI0008D0156D|nr:plasmid mobilization relaxosome protein MobC [Flavobacterium sp. fv08]SEP06209.1 hypothetical protein SAMN04487978_4353 [Flavobacterium sp. fv08]
MMEEKKNNRTRWLHLRLTPEEYKMIMVFYLQSTCRKLSEYARLQLLKKPVIGKFRNQSQDDLMTEIIALRSELNAIGNNFNQSVKRLHTLNDFAEFRQWTMRYELDKASIASKLESLKVSIGKIGELWLQ